MMKMDEKLWAQAMRLLRDARGVINEELSANGPEEIASNPILMGHEEVVDKIDAFLKRHD